MKKILCVILALWCLLMSVPSAFAETCEVWSPTPMGACGLSTEDVRLNRAIRMGKLELIQIPELGDKIFFGTVICDIDDGGYKGNSDMLLFYYYLLLDTDNGFVILDSIYDGNEHYEGSTQSVLRLSDVLDLAYFKNAGYDVPYYMICPTGRYSYSSYPSDTNYYFITDQYKIVKYSQSNNKNTPYTPAVKDNRLYGARKTYLSGSSTYVYNVQELAIKDSIVILQNTQSISTTVFEEEYTSYGESYASNIENKTFYTLPCVENMYAHINTTTQINSSGITEYYDVISLYKNVNYDMVKIKEEIFPGSITSKLTDIYGITGLDEDKYTQKGCSMPVARTGNYFI